MPLNAALRLVARLRRFAILLLFLFAALLWMRASEARCCAPSAGNGAPLVIPVLGYGGEGADTDPGAIPDRHLFAVILDNTQTTSASLARNCPGGGVSRSNPSGCRPYKYVNFLHNFCSTPITLAAYRWADAGDEGGFLHTYPGPKALRNRLIFNATPNPVGRNCLPHNANAVMRMDPGDDKLNSYLYDTVWTGSDYRNDFPAPYGAMEDDASVLADIVVGGLSRVSTEYGSGVSPSGFADKVGNSPYHNATDYESALGAFVNGACRTKCLDVALNGVATGYGNIGACTIIRNGHCHDGYYAGMIDDQSAIDDLCAVVGRRNLKFLAAERPVFAGRFGFGFLDSQTVTAGINTNANLYSHMTDGCADTKIVDVEVSYGQGGHGDITGGYRVRLAALAWRWLVANPATGVPDRVVSFQYTEGGTPTEVPYFFEDTLVPIGAETTVAKFVWNGKIQTIGGGCPSREGDSGGAVSLLVQCVGPAGIYCQQYENLYIDGAGYGKTAACFNTSTITENIASSWFKHDPISSYHYVLALKGGEMTSVPYRDVPGGAIPLTTCTNRRYCTGTSVLSSQVAEFKGNGADALCGPCGLILLQKK